MVDRRQIREGMTVFTGDGEKLGKVQSCEASTFTIEKGFFFPKDTIARFEDVAEVSGDEIRLAMTRDEFAASRQGEGQSARTVTGTRAAAERPRTTTAGEEVRVPVAEEELDVAKRDRQAGEVRLRKDVVTETKHVDVPVTREEVHVERTPAAARSPSPGEATFQEKTVLMPVHEEEVEIRKRPVVKEEVRLRKERVTEQRAAEAEVRKERVDIEGEDGAHRLDEPSSGTRRIDEDASTTRRSMDDPSSASPPPYRDDK